MSVSSITQGMDGAAFAAHMERVEQMVRNARSEAQAMAPEFERFAMAAAVVPSQSYVRIMLNGESRVVLAINVPTAFGEQSLFFDSTDPSAGHGRTLLKTHHPELMGTFDEFCRDSRRQKYLQALLKHASLSDGVQVIRAVDYMDRTQMDVDVASVMRAVEVIRSITPLPQRRPEDFMEIDHARP